VEKALLAPPDDLPIPVEPEDLIQAEGTHRQHQELEDRNREERRFNGRIGGGAPPTAGRGGRAPALPERACGSTASRRESESGLVIFGASVPRCGSFGASGAALR